MRLRGRVVALVVLAGCIEPAREDADFRVSDRGVAGDAAGDVGGGDAAVSPGTDAERPEPDAAADGHVPMADAGPATPDILRPPPDAASDGAPVPADVSTDAPVAPPNDALQPPPDVLEPLPDAFEPPPDAFQPPPDALQPPPDAFVPPPDAFLPPPDAFQPDAFVRPPDALQPPPDAELPCGPSPPCGRNGRGLFPGHCENGVFVADGACRDPDVCVDGDAFDAPCGPGGRGLEPWACVEGRWATVGPCEDSVCALTVEAQVGHTAAPRAVQAFDRGTCGGDGVERPFHFVAPAATHYAFRAADVAFDTAVYLRSACADPATELVCSAATEAAPAQAVREMVPGEEVWAFVDALHGDVGNLGLEVLDACAAGLPLRLPDLPLAPAGTQADFALGNNRLLVAAHVVVPPARDEVHVAVMGRAGQILVRAAPLSAQTAARARVGWNGTDFGVVWRDLGRGTGALYYKPVTTQGVIGAEARLTQVARNPDARTFDLAWDATSGAWWLVWTEGLRDELQALRFTAAGVVTAGPFVLDAGVSADLEPSIVVEADGGLGVAFGDRAGNDVWSAFARYDANGVRRGEVIRLNVSPEGSLQHTLTRAGQTWGLAYEDRVGGVRHVMFQRFDAQGARLGAALQLTTARDGGSRPRAGAGGGEFATVYQELRGDPPEPQLVYQAVRVNGQRRGPAVQLTTRGTERDHLRLRWVGDDWALTWWEAGLRQAFYTRGTLGCPP